MKVNFSQIIVKQIGFPSVTTTFIINVLKDSPGYRRDRVAIHGIEITISLRLLIVWGIDVNKLDENTIIRSTDLEITIVTKLPATINETGSAAIPLQPLLEITNEINDDRITLSVNQQHKIELKTDNGIYD